MRMLASLLSLLLLLVLHSPMPAACDHSISDYGAVPHDASSSAAAANGLALFKAIQAAAAGANGSRTAIVPRDSEFYFVPYAAFDGVSDIELRLDGTLRAYVPVP
jgi:hypothetical protein